MKTKNMTFDIYCIYVMKIPGFIKTTSKTHKKIWDEMSSINDDIKNLLVGSVLTEYRLGYIHRKVNTSIEIIDELLMEYDEIIGSHIEEYYENLFTDITQIAVEEEAFEMAANLKKYQELYGV